MRKSAVRGFQRGRIERIGLKKPFIFNGHQIIEAIIEIDHINYGLNKKTFKLNRKKRSNFTVSDIEKFLYLLNEEFLLATKQKGRLSRFEARVDSPIPGKYFGKEYVLVFEFDSKDTHLIHTITLFRRW